MADRIELQLGRAPWQPSDDSALVATYRYYDAPLTGLVSQHGNEYVFSCLDGELDTLSLWWYAPIRRDQRERLERLSAEDFEQAFKHENLAGWSVLAFATERLGLVDFEAIEDSDDPEILRARMGEALHILQQRLNDLSGDAEHLELTLA